MTTEKRLHMNERQNTRNRKNPETRLKRLYGLSLEQWDEMVLNRGGMCDICGLDAKLCVDHDHITNKIRGLLCATCNQGIGLLKDSSAVTQLATNYLKQHGK